VKSQFLTTIAVFLILQDDSGDVRYSTSNPVCSELHVSAHRHGDCVIVGSTCGLCFAQSSGLVFAFRPSPQARFFCTLFVFLYPDFVLSPPYESSPSTGKIFAFSFFGFCTPVIRNATSPPPTPTIYHALRLSQYQLGLCGLHPPQQRGKAHVGDISVVVALARRRH
jgi:hypothetical protein